MDWLKNRVFWGLIIIFFVIGLAGVIWNAIPGILKILAVIAVVFYFVNVTKK